MVYEATQRNLLPLYWLIERKLSAERASKPPEEGKCSIHREDYAVLWIILADILGALRGIT